MSTSAMNLKSTPETIQKFLKAKKNFLSIQFSNQANQTNVALCVYGPFEIPERLQIKYKRTR